MAAPIILWNPKAVKDSDDAGNAIIKTILAPPVTSTPRYRAYDPEHWRPRHLPGVPKLASFCIRVLSQYPEQLHQLGDTRFHFDLRHGGTDCILRAVLPKWKTPHFSLLDVDPRLWATIVQIYNSPPSILRSYPCQLSDPHVPLLNQIPWSPDFSLLTVLDLTGSQKITDDNIFSLKALHNLTALDLTRCYCVSSRGIGALSRTLTFSGDGKKRGPWPLRILRLRWCISVDKSIFNFLHAFPLLSVVDLRDTRCTARDIKRPFFSASDGKIFDLPLNESVNYLSKAHQYIFSNLSPFILSLQDAPLPSTLRNTESVGKLSGAKPVFSHHNNFVVLPPSRGGAVSGSHKAATIQFGNVDAKEFLEKKAEREERENWRDRRDEYYRSLEDSEDYDEGPDTYAGYGHSEEWSMYDHATSEDSSEDDDISSYDSYDENSDGSDEQLISALRESARGMERVSVAGSNEDLANAQSLPTLEATTEQERLVVPTRKFYIPPLRSAPKLKPRASNGPHEMALLRKPPKWYTLDSITANSECVEGNCMTLAKRKLVKNSDLRLNRKRKANMDVLNTEMSKRRKPGSTMVVPGPGETQATRRNLSPPPSPTSTVCDTNEMTLRRNPPLRPISNLQPPPRSSFPCPPRLKLDSIKTSGKSAMPKPQARFSIVTSTRKSRNMSLAESFKVQAQRPAVSIVTGIAIKAPGSKSAVHEVESQGTMRSKDQHVKSPFCRKEVKTPESVGAGVGRFDWDRWRKR